MVESKIVYIATPNKNIAFSTKRIAVNFIPYGSCTNNCIFCRPNIPAMEDLFNHKVILEKEIKNNEIISEVINLQKQNKDCTEIVITGSIGEPLLYLDKLIRLIQELKKLTTLSIRLNTNGQAEIIIPDKSLKEIATLLENSGLDSIAISLNAINKEDYKKLCQPKNDNSFESIIGFIKACNKTKIKTYISFVDYSKTHPNWPEINKSEIEKFLNNLGIKENQIIYRPLIE